MKEKIEISFQDWEKKLAWVIKYNDLMAKQDLTLEDCAVLPNMRVKAIENHKAREGLQKPGKPVVNNTPKPLFSKAKIVDPVQDKFQNAVNNLIAKFCDPVEEEYSLFLKELTAQAPQRDDFLKFTDELKARHTQAAQLRYLAKTDDMYNDSIIRAVANRQPKPEVAAAKFDSDKEQFKKRYITEVLIKDKLILQNRVSELKDEEAKTLEIFNKNKAAITETDQEINKLVQPIKQDIISKKATLLPKGTVVSGIPTPRMPPPRLNTTLGKSPTKNQDVTTGSKQPQKAASFNPLDITAVKLKTRKVEDTPEKTPDEQQNTLGNTTQDLAKAFGSLFKGDLQRAEATKVLPPKKEKTMEEIEESLDALALSILNNEQNIEQMKECIKQQNAFMLKQKAQLRDLQNKDWKTEIHGEVKKAETSDEPMKMWTATRPAPKFIPKPPPNNMKPFGQKAEPKKVEVKEEEKLVVEELTEQQQLMQGLHAALEKRRLMQNPDGEDDWDNENEAEEAEKKQRAEAENKRIAEENERKKAVVKRYEASVQERNLVPEIASPTDNSRSIANELLRLETKGKQPTALAQLEEAVKELKELESKAATVEPSKEATPQIEKTVETPKGVTPQVEKTVETPKEVTPQEIILVETPKEVAPEIVLVETIEIVTLKVETIEESSTPLKVTYVETYVDNVETPVETPVDKNVEASVDKNVETPVETPELNKSTSGSVVDTEAPDQGVEKLTSDTPADLEESEESIRAKFKLLCEDSKFLQRKVAEKEPKIGVIKDILAIKHFVETQRKEAETKNIDASDKKAYTKSLSLFELNAWNIRLSDAPLAKQKMQLENLGSRVFSARHAGRRALADFFLFLSCFLVVGIAIGVGRVIAGRTFFFGDAATQRESDFRKTLVEDESANRLIAPVA